MYQLLFIDGDNQHVVGLFETVEDVKSWIAQIPFITTYESEMEFTIAYADIPDYTEIEWQGSIYPLTRHSFTGDHEIVVEWEYVPIIKAHQGMVPGTTLVEGYVYDNPSVKQYIEQRSLFKDELKQYFEAQGKKVSIGGLGSEDGEYITVEDGPFIHIDPSNVENWLHEGSIEAFLKAYE